MMEDGPCKAAREPQVSMQMQRLDKELARAAEIQASVKDRLEPVLRCVSPAAGGEGLDREQLVPMAARLYELADRVSMLNNEYEAILDRIEL
jgi:hypothetical protein